MAVDIRPTVNPLETPNHKDMGDRVLVFWLLYSFCWPPWKYDNFITIKTQAASPLFAFFSLLYQFQLNWGFVLLTPMTGNKLQEKTRKNPGKVQKSIAAEIVLKYSGGHFHFPRGPPLPIRLTNLI